MVVRCIVTYSLCRVLLQSHLHATHPQVTWQLLHTAEMLNITCLLNVRCLTAQYLEALPQCITALRVKAITLIAVFAK